ncbi:MAG: Resolvase/invertase-type recombinase catalytic protein [Patescibacteria group bacterium]|nr:Resolvase/invertase-type recombinase catalytic protein [Patescibacteria group bacterium]
MDKKTIGALFNDPFYIGTYKYGNNIVNLCDIYNFMPLFTPDEYIALSRNIANNFKEEFIGRSTSAKRLDFGLLREKVICDYCSKIMVFQRTKLTKGKNAGSYMLSFYCRNKDCIRHNEAEAMKQYGKKISTGIRAKYVTAGIEWTIRHCTKQNKKAYELYIGRLRQKLAVDMGIAKRKLKEARNELKRQEDMYAKYQNLQLTSPNDYKKHHNGKLEEHQNLINVYSTSINYLNNEINKLNEPLPTPKQFVELIQSYLLILQNTNDLLEEDAIYQEVVLNLRAGDNIVSVITLNPPYDLMADLSKVSTGRGERTRTSGLRVPNAAR